MTSDWSEEIRESIYPHNPSDLMTTVAALQLLPQNAEQALRLEALANIISTLPKSDDKTTMPVPKLRRLCNESPLADISWQEDPSEQPFTETFAFIGGSYIVFPGIVGDAVFVLQHLAWAITRYEEHWPSTFFCTAVETVGSGLTLSDLVATRAGLSRGTPPDSRDSGVHVPACAELDCLKRAVQVSYEDLEKSLDARGFNLGGFDPLMIAPGEASLERCAPTSGPLDARPVLQGDDSVVLAAPGLLLAAIRHKLVCLAQEYGVTDMLAKRYRFAVWHTVKESLDFLGHKHRNVPLPSMATEMPAIDAVFSMDIDKILYVSLTTDSLRGYDEDQVFGTWECSDLTEQLERRQKTVEGFLVQESRGLNEIVVLHLTGGLGRRYFVGLGPPLRPLESPQLLMKASELEVIALLEGGNPLMLREHAIASTQIRQHTQVFAWSALDEFSIYRGSQYSYYLNDEARPNAITIAPGSGLDLRLQVIDEFDRHAVSAFESGYYIEVIKIEPKYEMPIYTSVDLLRTKKQFALVVEKLPVCVWIIGPDYEEDPEQRDLAQVYVQVADLIAYWIWQFTPSIAPLLEPLRRNGAQTIVFKLRATPSQRWLRKDEQTQQDNQPIAEYQILDDAIALHVNPTLTGALEAPDNRGERVLMAVVLRALNEFVTDREQGTETTSWDIQSILDKHAPLGPKKKALVLSLDTNPAFGTSGLPRHRAVQMANKTRLLDEVGAYLAREVGVPVGPIRKENRTKILRKVVEFLYQRLCNLVSSLRPEFLMEWLIRYYEAVRYDVSHLSLTTPTRLACFSESEDFTAKVTKELQELREAGQTARFIIEYASAQPPTGLRPMSTSVYDDLQALGSEIISWAGISDLIHYGIADIDLWMLPSGRLGSNYQDLVRQAGESFLRLHSSEQIDRATDIFGKHWDSTGGLPERPPGKVDEIDSAFKAEYDYTLTELTTVMADCFMLGAREASPVKRSATKELGHQLSKSTGYSRSKVERILRDLSLGKRADFLEPPSPFRKEDVYPWRFGRPLSYMRRPLIQTTQGEEPVYMWGNLHLHDSISYNVDICLSGRLQARATSQELRALLAKFNQERGSAFTCRVGEVFKAYESLVVDSNIKKVGGQRIARNGNDLGDIDVLVINPRRHKVLVAECKDLSIARNPHEIANELQTLFKCDDDPPVVVRHQRRANWIEDNLALVLEHYGVESEGRWRVEPVLIIDEEMLTPHIYQPPMPVISFRTLEQKFVKKWI